MTDRVLTEVEVDSLELFAMRWNSNPRELARPCMKLIASHRLLQQRVTELEGQAEVCSGPCHSPGYKRDD